MDLLGLLIVARYRRLMPGVYYLQELNQRAQGEVTIREALRELDLWGGGAVFTLTDYEDSQKTKLKLIKDWKEIVNQVCVCVRFLLWSHSLGSDEINKAYYVKLIKVWFLVLLRYGIRHTT